MKSCTFFGHKFTPVQIKPILYNKIIELIRDENVRNFYIGNEGAFDRIARECLEEIKKTYPIKYTIVLAYVDKIKRESQRSLNETNSIFPDELLKVPPKFAISRRNYWMVKNSDYVITYVTHIGGGAATFKELAEKKKRIVYNIAE